MEYREKILALARTNPLLPTTVAKALATDGIMAGAMLSEMCSKGLLKTSALRVGGSPLYYVPGNEEQLLSHLQSLNEKDQRTVNLLKEQKIIRENEADPLIRVSLAQIKDFARPLTVTYHDNEERFYKWFSLTDKDAEELIRKKLEPEQKITPPVERPAEQMQPKTTPEQKPAVQETLIDKKEPTGDFWDKLHTFLTTNNIVLLERSIVKKKTDFDLILEIPSPVGKLSYYCKARSKKKVTDADISAAYVQGQIKKLPVIFITDGEPTKQAHAILTQLKGVTFKKV